MNSVGVLATGRGLGPAAWLEMLVGRDEDRDIPFVQELNDVTVQCPKCHALETLQFAGVKLTPCRKFSQKNGMVYHDCGSVLPCRLYG